MLNGATKVHGGYVGSGVWCVGVPVWGMWAKLGKSAQQHDRPKIEKISKNLKKYARNRFWWPLRVSVMTIGIICGLENRFQAYVEIFFLRFF